MSRTKPDAAALVALVEKARAGDGAALEGIVREIQQPIYRLALRMLWHPEDARDATQDILVRVITQLGGFRGDSALTTWVYRVAANYLLSAKKSRLEAQALSYEAFAADLDDGLDLTAFRREDPESIAILEEIKVGCTLAMLSCLDRPHRLAYILGEIAELTDAEGAAALEVTQDAFRKRLSRARRTVSDFMLGHCGLLDPVRSCRCHRRARRAMSSGRVDPQRLMFVPSLAHARRFPEVLEEIRALEATRRAAALLRSHADHRIDFVAELRELVAQRP